MNSHFSFVSTTTILSPFELQIEFTRSFPEDLEQ